MCMICKVIEQPLRGENPFFVKEFQTGILVLGYNQYFHGYSIFISKQHVTELYELEEPFLSQFMKEMVLVSKAVACAFGAEKMNYECLGNGESHLHWHLFPRFQGDLGTYGDDGKGPVWWLPREIMYDDNTIPHNEEIEDMKAKLLLALGE